MIIHFDKVVINQEIWNEFLSKAKENYNGVYSEFIGEISVDISEYELHDEIRLEFTNLLSDIMDEHGYIKIQESSSMQEKVLPIETNTESITYLFYSTNLCIIQTCDLLCNWIMQNFINIKIYYNKLYEDSNILFFDADMDEVICHKKKSYEDLKNVNDILRYTKDCIDNEIYINIHLDEYYISQKENYQKIHFVHENLMYGYNDVAREVYAYGFTLGGIVDRFSISFEEYVCSYEKGKIYYYFGAPYLEDKAYAVDLRTINLNCNFDFSLSIFLKKVNEYLITDNKRDTQNEFEVRGIGVHNYIINDLEQVDSKDSLLDVRIFTLLFEHKRSLLRRIQYISRLYKLDDLLENILLEYEKIVREFSVIKNKFIKQLLFEGYTMNDMKCINSAKVKLIIANKLRVLVDTESKILSEMICVLEKYNDR